MRHAHPASITPGVLAWAIERADQDISDLALALGTSTESVENWVDGIKQPTFVQARLIAKRLRVPFGFLFLSTAPPDDLPIPDFRTIDGVAIDSISLDLRDVLLSVLRKQSWLSDYRKESNFDVLEFVGEARDGLSGASIAQLIRRRLDLDGSGSRSTSADGFLRDLIKRVERLGVNVLRSGIVGNNTTRKLNIEEFRGFALSDEFAPFIFINSVDARQAQSFTLMHELVHIFRGDSGISGGTIQAEPGIEALCNQVAADVLVPPDAFAISWTGEVPLRDEIFQLSRRFHVSRYVIAIRAFESSKISQRQLDSLLDEYRSESRSSSRSPGGDFYRTLNARNGHPLTQGVVDAVFGRQTLIKDAAGVLDARAGQLPRIAREIQGGD
jgi:Zn-dependent peptidase ImmA (M78 family)